MRHPARLVFAILLAACGTPTPRVPFGALAVGLDDFLTAHPLATAQAIRADEIGRDATTSYHVVQVRGAEQPHRHVAHDLTVFMLRGHGRLTLDGREIPLTAGDAAVIPRGTPHWFANTGRAPAVALVAFAPPLDAPDTVPLATAVDSLGVHR
jgi:quercetin dioxygenase-like cupin family protein